MRDSGVDICLGPNVDSARDPLGGRNYEMYGEDPELEAQMSAGFIQGMQKTGIGVCVKHLCGPNDMTQCREALENGQLTMDVLDTHVGRVLKTIVEIGACR